LSAHGASAKNALCETESGAIEEAASHADAVEVHRRRALPMWNQPGPYYAPFCASTLMNLASRLGSLYGESAAPERGRPLLNEAIVMPRTPMGP